MRDTHAIAKHREQGLLASHQISLQQVLADGLAGMKLEGFVNPGILLDQRFFLNENGAQLAIPCQRGDGGFVNILIIGAEPIKHLSDKSGIECGVEFVGFHGVGKMRWPGVNALNLPVARAETKEFPEKNAARQNPDAAPDLQGTGAGAASISVGIAEKSPVMVSGEFFFSFQ